MNPRFQPFRYIDQIKTALVNLRLSFRPFVWGILGCFLTACSKDEVAPQLPNEYVLDRIEYFMGKDDRQQEIIIDLPTIEKENRGTSVLEIPYDGDSDDIVKTSLFVLDTAGMGLPHDLNLEDFQVRVPGVQVDGRIEKDSYLFSLSGTVQKEKIPVWDAWLKGYQISPNSSAVFMRQIKRLELSCSFEARIGNTTTMTAYTITGKWQGVLYYNAYSVTKHEYPLN